jgi:hypothetical protein
VAKARPRRREKRGLEEAARDREAAKASKAEEEIRRAKLGSGSRVAGSWVMLA